MGAVKYYAVRVHNMIVIRKTKFGLRKITSTLSKPGTVFALRQVTFTGGKVLGVIEYKEWVNHGGPSVLTYKQVERTTVKGMEPFLVRGVTSGSTTGKA